MLSKFAPENWFMNLMDHSQNNVNVPHTGLGYRTVYNGRSADGKGLRSRVYFLPLLFSKWFTTVRGSSFAFFLMDRQTVTSRPPLKLIFWQNDKKVGVVWCTRPCKTPHANIFPLICFPFLFEDLVCVRYGNRFDGRGCLSPMSWGPYWRQKTLPDKRVLLMKRREWAGEGSWKRKRFLLWLIPKGPPWKQNDDIHGSFLFFSDGLDIINNKVIL